jgi:hypothetical protein
MTAARRRIARLITCAGAFLAACEGEGDAYEDASLGNPVVAQEAGAGMFADGGASPGTPANPAPMNATDAGAIFPGTMPAPANSGMPRPSDASLPRPDSSNAPATPAAVPTDISSCTPPPAGASATAVKAWTMLNKLRIGAGSGCMNMHPQLLASAQSHCDYKAMNRSNAACTADAHSQIRGCPGFTGVDVQSREIAAGYPRNLAYTEVALTYGDNPDLAIPGWLVTPFHRIPMIDPWTTDMGWGGGPGCDVIDFGRGMVSVPNDTIVVFPYNGQTDVPVSFNGLEAPQPPAPVGGWPSGYPISIYAQKLSITEHVLTKDGTDTPLVHTWLDTANPGNAGLRPYFSNTALLYGAPFEPNTTYRVKLVGTYAGGALNREWTFTTGARRTTRF